jgi:hypothetical protein
VLTAATRARGSCSACATSSPATSSGDASASGEPVDAARSEHLAFRFGHPDVARPDDLIDRRDGRGSIRQRGDRLRAAQPVEFVRAAEYRSEDHCGQNRAVATGRRRHRHARHAGQFRGNDGHQHRRRIRRGTARHVGADGRERADQQRIHRPVRIAHDELLWPLRRVERGDPVAGEF